MYNCIYTVAIEYIHYTRLAGRWDVKRSRRPFGGRLDGDTKGSRVEIIISNASNRPIYEQIANQVKAAILSGELTEGEQLPSIRALANSLRVSVITTKRAYTDLEAAGFIETVQGKGCFVAGGNAELIREEQLRGIEELFGKAVAEGRTIGLSDGELQEMFALALEV